MESVLISGISYGTVNVLSYTSRMKQNCLELRESHIIPIKTLAVGVGDESSPPPPPPPPPSIDRSYALIPAKGLDIRVFQSQFEECKNLGRRRRRRRRQRFSDGHGSWEGEWRRGRENSRFASKGALTSRWWNYNYEATSQPLNKFINK